MREMASPPLVQGGAGGGGVGGGAAAFCQRLALTLIGLDCLFNYDSQLMKCLAAECVCVCVGLARRLD